MWKVLLPLGIGMLILAALFAYTALDNETTRGTVVSAVKCERTFEYEVGGQVFTGTYNTESKRSSSSTSNRTRYECRPSDEREDPVGTTFNVVYDPQRPEDGMRSPNRFFFAIVMAGLGVTFTAFGARAFLRRDEEGEALASSEDPSGGLPTY